MARAISRRTKAILAVHFGGAFCDVAALREICSRHGLFLIEDAAHAQGSEWKGKRAGSFGIVGSFSFQNGKVLSAGEGGMLVTSDASFAAKARSLANCGRIAGESFYAHKNLGTNFRLTGLQAAVLLAQFERLPRQIATRSANAHLLKEALQDVSAISWQREIAGTTQNSFYLLAGRLRDPRMRNQLCQALSAAGAPCTPFYPHTLYQNELYRTAECKILPCPVAEACVNDGFWLPHRVLLADATAMMEIAEVLRKNVATKSNAERALLSPLAGR